MIVVEFVLPHGLLYAVAIWLGAVFTSFGRLAVMRLPHQLGWRADADADPVLPTLTM